MGRETLLEVLDGLKDPPKVRDGLSPSRRVSLAEFEDRAEDPQGGSGRVGGPSRWFGTGLGTLSEVRDRSADTPGGSGWVRGISWRSWPCWGTLPKVRDGRGTV